MDRGAEPDGRGRLVIAAGCTDLAAPAAAVEADLGADPVLRVRFREQVPRAADTVCRRLIASLCRERLAEPPAGVRLRRHGFDRVEPVGPLPARPLELLAALCPDGPLAAELGSAVAGLALAYARRSAGVDPFDLGGAGPDRQALAFEQLATEGHNLHPCGRTRLGWSTRDLLDHDLEGGGTTVEFVGVRRDRHVGDDVGDRLGRHAPAGYVAQPVHTWQRRRLPEQLYTDGVLRHLDLAPVPGRPTAALRTLLLPDGRYLKLSLDIQVTSTRRTISVASTRNGPALSVALRQLMAGEPVLLMAEVAGSALAGSRDAGAILRAGLAGRLGPDEVPVPAAALTAALPGGRTVAATLVAAQAAAHGRPDDAGAALRFVDGYARLLLPPLLRLATRHGIALEAHLQNCLPVFRNGQPVRLVLRDFAGIRVHLPRLAARRTPVSLWPGSVIATGDVEVMLAKLAYTALQAHLGELVVTLVGSHDLDEAAAWRAVRGVVDEVYADLRADPATAADAAADHAFLTAPTVPHKALVRMRLAGDGDLYLPVGNPLR